MEKVSPGTERITAWMIVPLPTPEGPETTIRRPLGIAAAAPHVRAFEPCEVFPCRFASAQFCAPMRIDKTVDACRKGFAKPAPKALQGCLIILLFGESDASSRA